MSSPATNQRTNVRPLLLAWPICTSTRFWKTVQQLKALITVVMHSPSSLHSIEHESRAEHSIVCYCSHSTNAQFSSRSSRFVRVRENKLEIQRGFSSAKKKKRNFVCMQVSFIIISRLLDCWRCTVGKRAGIQWPCCFVAAFFPLCFGHTFERDVWSFTSSSPCHGALRAASKQQAVSQLVPSWLCCSHRGMSKA